MILRVLWASECLNMWVYYSPSLWPNQQDLLCSLCDKLKVDYQQIPSVWCPWRSKHEISEKTTFYKTQQHFTKHKGISKNTTTFHKTQRHFGKHNNISQNTGFQKTMTFEKTPHFRFQITERVGQHFLFVIEQNPSPWRQFNVISCFYILFAQHVINPEVGHLGVNYWRVLGCTNRLDWGINLEYFRWPKVITNQGEECNKLSEERSVCGWPNWTWLPGQDSGQHSSLFCTFLVR